MILTSKILTPKICVCGDSQCAIPFGRCHCGCNKLTNRTLSINYEKDIAYATARKSLSGHLSRRQLHIEEAKPFKIDGVYCRLIPLTRGQYAIVDASDYEWLMQWRWTAYWSPMKRDFYAVRSGQPVNGKRPCIRMHREILGLSHDDPRLGDHENGMGLDNRRKNLRPATFSQNQMNKALMRTNRSGRKGVTWNSKTKKWRVEIDADGSHYYLKEYDSFEEACSVREAAEREHHKEFSNSCQ